MCGLAAVIWKSGHTPENFGSVLGQLERGLVHRGPDEAGSVVGKGFAVVHRRLAIVDIADGHQPMLASDGLVGLVYNGEIYNHTTIRAELERRGHTFKTRCDTEVVLKAFLEYGSSAFSRFDGMFAIFLWDLRKPGDGEFHLVRDHMGTKPLYVYEDAARFVVSSELRPIVALGDTDCTLTPAGVRAYLSFRYTPLPCSIVRNIERVEAGTRWHIRNGRATQWRYWDLPRAAPTPVKSLDEAAEALTALLIESVRDQQMGEVPIALLLSGGLDSSAIAYACHRLGANYHTFSIGFPTVNEFEYSHAVAARFEQRHTTIEITPEEIVSLFPAVVEAMDEPMADPACFPLFALCREIRRHATVVLSGEGSDELLGGYPQYARLLTAPPRSVEAQFTEFLDASWYFRGADVPARGGFDPSSFRRHFGYFAERPLLDGMLAFDLKTWLPENLLMKADKILMSQSLEGRFPFLSRKIVEFAMTLPEALKWNDVGKVVLRAAMKDRLPEAVLTRPKMGFSVPVSDLLRMMRPRFMALIALHQQRDIAEIIDIPAVRRIADAHYSGGPDNSLLLWNLLVLLQWLDAQLAARGAASRMAA
jgi:asparagine synthase (glutamine-hydrolysing)